MKLSVQPLLASGATPRFEDPQKCPIVFLYNSILCHYRMNLDDLPIFRGRCPKFLILGGRRSKKPTFGGRVKIWKSKFTPLEFSNRAIKKRYSSPNLMLFLYLTVLERYKIAKGSYKKYSLLRHFSQWKSGFFHQFQKWFRKI